MHKPLATLAFLSVLAMSRGAAAQTVSAPAGSAGAIPFFSDSVTLTNSSIVDIAATSPTSSGSVTIGQPVVINGQSGDTPQQSSLLVNAGSMGSPTAALTVTGYQQYGNGIGLKLLNGTGTPNWGATTNILFAGGDAPDGWAMLQGAGADYSGGEDGFLLFHTKWNGVMAPRMMLTPQGNLGIGTTNPQTELSVVVGNPTTETGVHVLNTDSSGYSVIRLGVDGIAPNGSAWHQFNSAWPDDPASATAPLSTSIMAFESGGLNLETNSPSAAIRLFTGGGGPGNERVRVDPSGNVGIGTAAPAATLDVNGGIRASSFSYSDGTPLLSSASPIFTGNVGIGTTSPHASLDTVSTAVPLASNGAAFGNGNIVIEASGARSTSAGAALTFAAAANTDGSNTWEQGRILTVGGNSANADADGAMYLQTRTGSTTPQWGWTNNLVLTSDGSVGLGTATPGQAVHTSTPQQGPVLEVMGSIHVHGNIYFGDAPSSPQSQPYLGARCPAGGDYAESVNITGKRTDYEPGDVMVISADGESDVNISSEPYSTMVAGIYSTRPGFIGRRQLTDPNDATTEVPMAMVGIVPTKVSAENGPIHRGDLLVTSATPGFAMKGTDRNRLSGAVVGKALGSVATGTGLIEVLVTLQ